MSCRGRPARRPQPVDVLDDGRAVGAVLAVVLGHCLLARVAAEHRAADVAREELRGGEHDRAQQEKRDQREAEALEDVAGDGYRLSSVVGRRRAARAGGSGDYDCLRKVLARRTCEMASAR